MLTAYNSVKQSSIIVEVQQALQMRVSSCVSTLSARQWLRLSASVPLRSLHTGNGPAVQFFLQCFSSARVLRPDDEHQFSFHERTSLLECFISRYA
jgi:hypothetical protein